MGGGATRSPAVSADAGAGAGTGAAGAEFRAARLLSSSSRSAACSRACLSRCSSSSFSLKRETHGRSQKGFQDWVGKFRTIAITYRSCITGDMSPRDAGGSMSGLYLNPYSGYEGSPGNNGGLSIPHRSRYNCSSNLRIENEGDVLTIYYVPLLRFPGIGYRVDTLPISVLEVWRWVETVVIGAVGRRVQGKRRWSMGRMVLGPIRLKTRTGQQFRSGGSYTVFAGVSGSCSCVQRGHLLGSSLVSRSFLKEEIRYSLIVAAATTRFSFSRDPRGKSLRKIRWERRQVEEKQCEKGYGAGGRRVGCAKRLLTLAGEGPLTRGGGARFFGLARGSSS